MERTIAESKAPTIRARFAIASVCDEQGAPLFTDADVDQVNALPWGALDAIYQAAMEHNAMTPGAVDAAEKN